MPQSDPVGDLVLLARSAADAGLDWRARLANEWLPRALAGTSRAALAAALGDWLGEPPDGAADLGARLEAAVLEAMGEQGYD